MSKSRTNFKASAAHDSYITKEIYQRDGNMSEMTWNYILSMLIKNIINK